jgi:septal ring factor EnvC (AmiA/AmiB activator)
MGAAACLLWGALCASGRPAPLLDNLERIDKTLHATLQALRASQEKSQALQAQIGDLHAAHAAAQGNVLAAQRQFVGRLRVLARLPAGPGVVAAAQSGSYGDYLESSRVLKYIARHDQQVVQQLQARAVHLAGLEARLQAQQTQLQNTLATRQLGEDAVARDRKQRAAWLRELSQAPHHAAALAAERQVAQQQLQAMTLGPKSAPAASETSFLKQRGKLPMPAQGPVRVAFGQRVELSFGTVTAHNGWDIGAAPQSPVQAVAAGEVAFAGWLRGYGQVVIVDHAGGYHTTCAHLAGLQVEAGQRVAAGQRLGTVGDTGSGRGTVLYFEIRQDGVPQNPRPWFVNK